MKEILSKNILFTQRELLVLSAMAGMNETKILCREACREITPKLLNLTLFELYQKGMLIWKAENKYELKEEIRQLLRDICQAEKELYIYTDKKGSPLQCYWGERTVVCELSENDRDTVKIHSLGKDDFLTELQERGILPARDADHWEELLTKENVRQWNAVPEEILADMMQEEIGEDILEKYLRERDQLSVGILIYDRAAEKNRQVLLLGTGMYDWMSVIEGKNTRVDYYRLRTVRELLDLKPQEKEVFL